MCSCKLRWKKECEKMASEVKWIKIVTDIFDDEKILIIESMPDADTIIVIWFKLLCLAGKQNNSGVFTICERMPFTEEMFAAVFRRSLNSVRMAMKAFESLGMIEIINDTVTIPTWHKHQSLDAYEKHKAADRLYQQRKRMEKRAILLEGTIEPQLDTKIDGTSIETSTDIDAVDVDKDIDEKKEDNSNGKTTKKQKKEVTDEEALFRIPLSDGTYYNVGAEEIKIYRGLYPDTDIEQEYRNMIGWCNQNPKKTRKGVGRFVNGWLARSQNSARRNGYKQDRNAKAQKNCYVPVPDTLPDDDSNPFKR